MTWAQEACIRQNSIKPLDFAGDRNERIALALQTSSVEVDRVLDQSLLIGVDEVTQLAVLRAKQTDLLDWKGFDDKSEQFRQERSEMVFAA